MSASGAALAVAAGAVGAGALAQMVTGIGFSLVSAPVLIAVLGPRHGVREALVLSTLVNTAILARDHRRVMVGRGLSLLIPAMVVTPFVAWGSRHVDGRVLAASAGVLTVVSAAAIGAGLRFHRATGRAGAVVAGALSGTMNVIGSIGGPALALYSLNAGWPPDRTRPTLQACFLLTNLVALASLGVVGLPAALVAGLAAGGLAGLLLAHRVPDHAARAATLLVAGAGGLAAVIRALAG